MTTLMTYRVSFGDTDAGGIVYHARYFEMAERSRNETLRAAGIAVGPLFFGVDGPVGTDGIALVLHRGQAKYDAPAFVDDLLTLRTGTLKVNAARSWWRTVISRAHEVLCTVDVELVCIKRTSKSPTLMPSAIADAIQRIIAEGNGGINPNTARIAMR